MTRLDLQRFHCRGCGTDYVTARTTVLGLPIALWWDQQGQLCSACHAKAQAQRPTPAGLEAQFNDYHAANPHVYAALAREGRVLLARGHRKLGIKMLYERLRWQVYMETTDDQYDFKLPNNYTAYYARLLMEQEPDFAGVFTLAELRSRRAAA